ncbi:MAG: hypothetical protein QNL91_03375 [Candidatus Krumholzibacteria bacterium]|nr:hypothetical protein [Candidatus Krumholzibacteria bacterium]
MKTCQMNRLTQILVLAAAVLTLSVPAVAKQGSHRTTRELDKDLRATKNEYKEYKSLSSKLKSSAKQSSNTARETAVHKFQDFMGQCIERREGELGEEMTLKQHGKMVESGTTNVTEVGTPVPVKKSAKGSGVFGTTNEDRLRQLTNMKSLYVSAKNNSRPAIEKQNEAFERYSVTIEKFGSQLEWALNGLTEELERREAEKKEKEEQQEQEE